MAYSTSAFKNHFLSKITIKDFKILKGELALL
jgi:hypothetical protein